MKMKFKVKEIRKFRDEVKKMKKKIEKESEESQQTQKVNKKFQRILENLSPKEIERMEEYRRKRLIEKKLSKVLLDEDVQ